MAVQNTPTDIDTEVEIPADLTTLLQDVRLSDGYRAMVKLVGVSHGLWFLDKESVAAVDGVTVVATMSGVGRWVKLQGPGGLLAFAMFYGLTSGTGYGGPNDYAATVGPPGSSVLPFPRNGPTSGPAIARNGAATGTFVLAAVGTYQVSWAVCTTEPGQWQLRVNDVVLPETVAMDTNPTAGGHPISNTVLITTTVPNSTIEVFFPPGNTPALTITPANGASTHAQAPSLVITRLA